MRMTPRQIELVQASWAQVLQSPDSADAVAQLFYGKLFGLDPSLKPMFKGDMNEQGRKLMTMITFVVRGLTRLEAIVPGVQALGQRHARYGVQDRHYATVGSALLSTLALGLGTAFTDEVRDAWATAYGLLAGTMRDAAKLAA
jgi:hemoglobin-like flavoprotein